MAGNPRLYRKEDQVFLVREGEPDQPVKVVWMRPVRDRGRSVAFLGEKEETFELESIDLLDADSRKIAEEELRNRYIVAEIRRILRAEAHYGNRYWEVETDRGLRTFVTKNPYVNIRRNGDELLIRDAMGNMFRIPALSKLDEHSRAQYERVT